VALEVGYPETAAKLEKDIAWWINNTISSLCGETTDLGQQQQVQDHLL